MWERENQRGALVPNIAPATQRGPHLLHRIFPKSDPPYGGSASITLTWASVSTRSLPLGLGPLGHYKPVVPHVLDRRDCGVPLLHRTNEVGEVSGRRISEARGEGLLPRPGNLVVQVREEVQLSPHRAQTRATEETHVKLRWLGFARLIGPV